MGTVGFGANKKSVGFAVDKKPAKKIHVNFKKKFLNKIKNIFVDHKFKLIPLKRTLQFKDKILTTETLQVDGKTISISWTPRLENMKSKDMYDVLLKDCTTKVQELLNEDGEDKGKML